MAHTVPTAADLIALYPAFADVATGTINAHIATASTTAVGTEWPEAYYAPAINAKAAHEMALLGLGTRSQAAGYAADGVTRIKSGDFEASFSNDAVAQASAGGLDSTPYGRAYRLLLRKAKAGPRIVARGSYSGPL